MKAMYSYDELEVLLSDTGFLIDERMNADEATAAFFWEYNRRNPEHSMTAPQSVGYCLCVKN